MTESAERSGVEQPEPDTEFEAKFAQLVKDVEEGRKAAVEEPSARARMLAAQWRDQPPSAPRQGAAPSPGEATSGPRKDSSAARVWPRNLAIAVIIGALTFGAVELRRQHGSPGAPAASSADSTPSVARGASADASASASASMSASADSVSQIPVSRLYPQTVRGADGTLYTLVTAGPLNSCTNSDMVGTALAGLFARSKGCLGGEGALYKDAAKDQFNMTVFTLQDPEDVVTILTELSMNPADFEVGVLEPPADSGLAALSATSGITQQFAGSGHYLGVFMAQWSDGRTADYESLQKLLSPLENAITATMQG